MERFKKQIVTRKDYKQFLETRGRQSAFLAERLLAKKLLPSEIASAILDQWPKWLQLAVEGESNRRRYVELSQNPRPQIKGPKKRTHMEGPINA